MPGENATFSAFGYGSVSVPVERFSHGIDITGSSDAARTRKAFYIEAVSASHFTVTILTGSDPGRFALLTLWFKSYGDRLANPNGGVGPMRVQVPSRNFDRLAILKSGVRFGETLDEVGRRITLSFIGARSPGDFDNPMASQFIDTTDTEGRYFYPGGKQLTVADDPEDSLYGGTGWGSVLNRLRHNVKPLPTIQVEE